MLITGMGDGMRWKQIYVFINVFMNLWHIPEDEAMKTRIFKQTVISVCLLEYPLVGSAGE